VDNYPHRPWQVCVCTQGILTYCKHGEVPKDVSCTYGVFREEEAQRLIEAVGIGEFLVLRGYDAVNNREISKIVSGVKRLHAAYVDRMAKPTKEEVAQMSSSELVQLTEHMSESVTAAKRYWQLYKEGSAEVFDTKEKLSIKSVLEEMQVKVEQEADTRFFEICEEVSAKKNWEAPPITRKDLKFMGRISNWQPSKYQVKQRYEIPFQRITSQLLGPPDEKKE
jgi:hypothetical protein